MHILFLTENFPPERNAVASRVYERACYWVRWGHQVTVLTGVPNFPEGKIHEGYRNRWYQVETIDGIRVVRVKTFIVANEGIFLRTVDFLSFMVSAFVAGLFQTRPDVVVGTSPQFFTVIAACFLAGVRKLPFVFELSDLWPASITAVGAMRENVLLRWIERLELCLYHRSARVVALTEAFRENLIRRGVPAEKVVVVMNGVDLSRFAPIPRDQALARELKLEDCFVVGYLGTHGMAHALNRVLEAAELLHDIPQVKFLFVGAGAARTSLIEEASRRGLANVLFVAAQPKERMQAYWSLCDLALIHLKDTPLFATVIPSKIFEAMGMGRAILLAAPRGEAASVIHKTGAGLVIKPEHPIKLANAVRALYHDRESLGRFAKQSLASAPQFSREKQAFDMLVVIEQAAFPSGSSRSNRMSKDKQVLSQGA